MYLKINRSKGKDYLVIVEGFRDEKGVTRQKSIASLGAIDKLQKGGNLRKLLKSINKISDSENKIYDIEDGIEVDRIYWGAYAIVSKLWDKYELDLVFNQILKKRNIQFNFYEAVFRMLVDRFAFPCSKYSTYKNQNKFGVGEQVDLHQFYRALDVLADSKEEIELSIFNKNVKAYGLITDVVFYDVTTLHFESVLPNDLKDFGFSKNAKFGEVQIVMGLLTNQEGLPIGYEIFPGNMYEGNTLKLAIEKLKNRFKIGKLIFIADQGMLSLENINTIRSSGYEYIIGARIKNRPLKIKEEILDLSNYEKIEAKEEGEILKFKEMKSKDNETISQLLTKLSSEPLLIKDIRKILANLTNTAFKKRINSFLSQNIILLESIVKLKDKKQETKLKEKLDKIKDSQVLQEIKKNLSDKNSLQDCIKRIISLKIKELTIFLAHSLNERMIVTYSSKRAKKNKKDRNRLVEKAKKLIVSGQPVISKNGYRKFLKTETGKPKLDLDKIVQEEQWDGFFGIDTNNKVLTPENISAMYHLLWRIEESFKIFKSHLKTRPIFHSTPNRIKGHLVLCFIAFLLERFLEIKLKKNSIDYSVEKIRDVITSLQASVIEISGQKFYVSSKVEKLSSQILQILEIKEPPKITKDKFFDIKSLSI